MPRMPAITKLLEALADEPVAVLRKFDDRVRIRISDDESAIVTVQIINGQFVFKVSRRCLDYGYNIGNVFAEFCKQWRKDHPGTAAHIWYTHDGWVPIFKKVYEIPDSKKEMKRLVQEIMLGTDMQDALAFLDEIEDNIRR